MFNNFDFDFSSVKIIGLEEQISILIQFLSIVLFLQLGLIFSNHGHVNAILIGKISIGVILFEQKSTFSWLCNFLHQKRGHPKKPPKAMLSNLDLKLN